MLAYQQDVDRWVHIVPYTSVSAFNLWWLLGVAKLPSSAALLGPFSPDVLGWAMFLAVLAQVTYGAWRDGSSDPRARPSRKSERRAPASAAAQPPMPSRSPARPAVVRYNPPSATNPAISASG